MDPCDSVNMKQELCIHKNKNSYCCRKQGAWVPMPTLSIYSITMWWLARALCCLFSTTIFVILVLIIHNSQAFNGNLMQTFIAFQALFFVVHECFCYLSCLWDITSIECLPAFCSFNGLFYLLVANFIYVCSTSFYLTLPPYESN